MKNELLKSAVQNHLRNNFQEAYNQYASIIQNYPLDHHTHHLLGLLLIQNGFLDQGNAHIANALSIKPDYAEVIHNKEILLDPARGRHWLEDETINQQKLADTVKSYPQRPIGKVDDWRHMRMLSFIEHLSEVQGKWLTLGDHYGHDAQRIIDHGVSDCTPTSLSTEYLEIGKKGEFIEDYMKINAEEIPLEDNSYDVLVCKEALHHMPRPYRAIYEMLRVSKKFIIIIEPNDTSIDWRPEGREAVLSREFYMDDNVGESVAYSSQSGERIISRYIDWWEDGPNNYVYTLSEREITKIALGYGLQSFATYTFNDYYSPEYGSHEAKNGTEGYDKTLEQIHLHDLLCERSGIPKSYVAGIFFKQSPAQTVRERLKSYGFNFRLTRTRLLPYRWPTL